MWHFAQVCLVRLKTIPPSFTAVCAGEHSFGRFRGSLRTKGLDSGVAHRSKQLVHDFVLRLVQYGGVWCEDTSLQFTHCYIEGCGVYKKGVDHLDLHCLLVKV